MSITGISGSSFIQALLPASGQTKAQQLRQEFQQLGQDLQSGNLSAAQSEFAALQQNVPAAAASTSAPSSTSSTKSTLAQAFSQLTQDLQSGNLSGAQSDFAAIQQDAQQIAVQGSHGHHHHHHAGEPPQGPANSRPVFTPNQAFSQLGQALQSGNITSAQQAYTSLQQDFQQYAALGAESLPRSSSSSAPQGSVNVSA